MLHDGSKFKENEHFTRPYTHLKMTKSRRTVSVKKFGMNIDCIDYCVFLRQYAIVSNVFSIVQLRREERINNSNQQYMYVLCVRVCG